MKIFLLSALLCLLSCIKAEEESVKEPTIIGKWEMHKVFDGDSDVTRDANFNPEGNRWAQFNSDSTFITDGDPYGRNTGRWSLNDSTKVLFLDSDADEGDDSYWIVDIKSDTMHWQGTNSAFTELLRVIHLRSTIE